MNREQIFSKRLQQLRAEKGVSRIQMSQDLKMADSYIYNIEAGYAYPSMTQFFAICEYFDILPYEFMKFEPNTNSKEDELLDTVQGLSDADIDVLIQAAEKIKKGC